MMGKSLANLADRGIGSPAVRGPQITPEAPEGLTRPQRAPVLMAFRLGQVAYFFLLWVAYAKCT